MPSKRAKQRFASLYVHGPHAGNWAATAELVGGEFDPQDAEVREAVGAEGGVVPEVFEAKPTEPTLDAPPLPKPTDPVEKELLEAAEFLRSEDWLGAAKRLSPVIANIAAGLVEASPAQRMMLKEIMDRAYGKAGSASDLPTDETLQPIVFLPLRGDFAGSRIATMTQFQCPNCGQLTQFERDEPA